MNFKQHLQLLKTKTTRHVAGNVGYCPTLQLSAIRHLRPPHGYSLNRSYTKSTGSINISHSASGSQNHTHSNVVNWAATNSIVTANLKKVCLPTKTFISWKHTKVAGHCTLYTGHCTLYTGHYTVHCTLYTVHCTLYTGHCTLYTVHWTLNTVHCTLYTGHCTLYTVHCTLDTVHWTLYTVHCTLYTVHWTQSTLPIWRQCTTGFLWQKNLVHMLFARL